MRRLNRGFGWPCWPTFLDYIKFKATESKCRCDGGVDAGPECKGEMRSGPGDLKREVRGNLCGFSDMTSVRP